MGFSPDEKKEPDEIIHVGGKDFRLYKYYDDISEREILDLPNFEETPEYADDGRPFVLRVQDGCPYGKAGSEKGAYDDCADCVWFYCESSGDPIGVCMNEKRRREQQT